MGSREKSEVDISKKRIVVAQKTSSKKEEEEEEMFIAKAGSWLMSN